MPTIKITSITVSTTWDDDTVSETKITHTETKFGEEVVIDQYGDSVSITKVEWNEVKEQIDGFFDE